MLKTLRRILGVYRPFKKVVIGMFGFILISQALSLISPYIYGKIIDAIFAGKALQDVIMLALVSLALNLAGNLIDLCRDHFELKTFDYKMTQHVSNQALNRFLDFSIGQHLNKNSGIKMAIISTGQRSLSQLAYNISYNVLPLIVQVLMSLAALIYISTELGLLVLLSLTIVASITIYINIHFRENLETHKDLWIENGKLYSETISNVEVVKANAQEKRMVAENDKSLVNIIEFGTSLWKKFTNVKSLRDAIISLTRFAVMALGVYFVYQGKYTPGYLVMFLSWSTGTLGRLNSVGQLQRQCMEQWVDVKKYFALLDVEPAIKIIKNPVRNVLAGKIEMRNVTFSYPVRSYAEGPKTPSPLKQEKPALSDINLTVEPGRKVAFVGHSGAGKTTLAYLLLRAYDPDKGQIIIDGNDLRLWDLNHFLCSVGLVEQDVCLFDNTLRYNITFGLNGKSATVTNKELEQIARTAGIEQFFDQLEDGFDTLIGEKGIKLSGGERQRVGIARALIKDPKILVFDEATSHLDSANESLIRQAINNASMGRTTIIIAHRLSTIKDADKIFVLEKGSIVGQGKHNELLVSCEQYYNLIGKQIVTI